MKALLVLSAVIAVALCAPPVDKVYARSGAYVPWQPPRYHNSYNPVRNVYSSPRWYQSTITPIKYEASTFAPWQSQGKSKFSFGSFTSTPAAVVQTEGEKEVKSIVEAAPAVPKVPAGFGAFHFGKKSTPIVVAKEEIKPVEVVAPEIKISKIIIESSSSAEASLKSISNEESAQALKKEEVVPVSEEIKPVVVETAAAVQPEAEQEVKLVVEAAPTVPKVPAGFGAFHFGKKSTPIVVAKEEIKPVVVAPEIKISKIIIESSSSAEASPKSIPNEGSAQALKKEIVVPVPDEIKPVVVETVFVQSQPEIKSSVEAELEVKSEETLKKLDVEESNEKLNKTSLAVENSNIESAEKSILEAKPVLVEEPKSVSLVENQPISEIKSEIVAPVVVKKKHGFSFSFNPSSNVYNRNSLSLYSQVQPSAAPFPVTEIKPIVIQAIQPAIELKPVESAVAESDKATVAPASLTTETLQETTENIPSTYEYVVPTLDISQPIIQYASPSEESASTTTESSSAPSEYASEYSPINSESIDALLSTLEATVEPTQADIKQETYDYSTTEPEASTTENAPVTESASNEYLQNDFEPALTTVQSQPANIEYVQAIESSAPLISSVQSESAAIISSQSFSYSSTPSIVKKKHGFSFSYNPSGYVYNKEASFAYKPSSETAAPEIAVAPAATTLAPNTIQYLQPVVSTVVPTANIWGNSYNGKKNSFSFSYNPTFSYVNKPYYQPAQINWAVPSDAPAIYLPAVEIAPLTIESTPAPEYIESTTALFEDSSEDSQSITTESSPSETTTLSIEYGTTESELASTTADLGTESAIIVSSTAATESLPASPVTPQILPAVNGWSNSYNTKKNGFSFTYFPSFFNKPVYQPQAVIAPASSSVPSVEPLPSLAESSEAAIELSSTTESYSDETTAFTTESNESLSTTQTSIASIELVSAAIESSLKEVLNGQLTIASIPKETAPVVVESAPAAIKPEPSPVLIESVPASAASVQAIPVPLYVKEVSKVSLPAALPTFQPLFVTKKHGFSFSYKPSGNFYKKPEVIASVAPVIVESSPEIASVAPVVVESSPVIASVVPSLAEASQEVAKPSLLSTLFKAVNSAILEEDKSEKSIEAKPEIAIVAAEPQKLKSEDVSSQYDFAVKASPLSPVLKEEVNVIHDLRLGN